MNYRDEVMKLVRVDVKKAVDAVRAAYNDKSVSEDILGSITGILFDASARDGVPFVIEFVTRYPGSLHLMRVICADIYNNNKNYDAAIFHARLYLRLVKDNKLLEREDVPLILKHGIARAFSALADGYAGIGAYDYAIRVLQYALRYVKMDELSRVIRATIDEYAGKRTNPEAQAQNGMWEAFFKSGSGMSDVLAYCDAQRLPELAKRVELIEGSFRFNSRHVVDDSEILQIVNEISGESKKSGYILL